MRTTPHRNARKRRTTCCCTLSARTRFATDALSCVLTSCVQLQKEKLRRMEEDMLALELLLHTPPVAHSQHASAPSLNSPQQMNGTSSGSRTFLRHCLSSIAVSSLISTAFFALTLGVVSSGQGQRADSLPSALTATATVNQAAEPLPHTPGHVNRQHQHPASANGHAASHQEGQRGAKLDDELQRAFSRSERLCAELRERCQQIERMQNNVSQLDESAPTGRILPEVRSNSCFFVFFFFKTNLCY